VAEDVVVGKAPGERALEHVDVVDSLADERAFAEGVLVHIRNRARIRVDARIARMEACVPRPVRSRQAHAHTRLQDPVALGHLLRGAADMEARAIERMRHHGHELAGRVPRQLGVGVERDHVLHSGERRGIAHDEREAVRGAPAQEPIQVGELAALALAAHPRALVWIPVSWAMQEEEGSRRVLAVERLDPFARETQQGLILGQRLGRGILEIGQQGEVQLLVAVREERDLERLQQGLDARCAAEHRRHHGERARARRNAQGEVHARQRVRLHEKRGQPVHHSDGELARGEHQQDPERKEHRIGGTLGTRPRQQGRGEDGRDRQDRAEVQGQRDPSPQPACRFGRGHARARRALEVGATLVDQVEADVPRAIVLAGTLPPAAGLGGERHRHVRDLALAERAVLRDRLDHVAIAIARGEIHPSVQAGRVAAQLELDDADALEELAPVHRAEEPQAADGVADGDLEARLLLRVGLHQLLDRHAGLRQALLDPREGQGKRGALPLQPARQLGDERARHRRVRARHVGDHQDQALGIASGDVHHLVGPGVGAAALLHVRGDQRRDAAQVLDQREAQHDRDGPELAHLERRHALVGRHEAREAFVVDAAVAVGDRLEGEVVHARIAGGGPVGETRELAAVSPRQVAPRRADLLLDQVEVVEQPLRRGRDPPPFGDREGESVAGLREHALVVREPRQQAVGARAASPTGAPPRVPCRGAPSARR
jgi:hypothetical protein